MGENLGGSSVPIEHKVAWVVAYLRANYHLDLSSRLATINMGRTFGGAPFFGGGAWSPSNTKSLGPRPTSVPSGILIHAAIWPQQIWAENWGLCPFGEGELVPIQHNVARAEAYLHAKFHLDPSNVWPQCTNVADRETGQRSDSMRQTVLQTVAPKRGN